MTGDQGAESESPTKLVYLINSLYTGGAEIGLSRLLQGIDPERYDVTVVALWGHEQELVDRIPDWVTVVDLELTRRPNLSGVRVLLRSLWNADVIIGSLYHATLLARFAGVLNGAATVGTWQHNEIFKNEWRKRVFLSTVSLNDVVLADSEAVAEFLAGDLSVPLDYVHVVPIAGLEVSDYSNVTHGASDPLIVGSVGRIVEQKNYALLLDVAEQLPESSNFRFEIAGNGDQLEVLRQAAESRGLDNVTFHGTVSSVPEFLATLDIYVQPSLHEGLCITVLEAMAAGLPIVGSEVGGIARNVEHGESGFLCDPGDVDGFASRIEELSSDPALRQRFGDRGRRIVEESFTRDVLVTEFEKAIRTDD